MNYKKPMKQCCAFITFCCFVLGIPHLLKGNYLLGSLIILVTLGVDAVYLFSRNKHPSKAAASVILFCANLVILITQIVSGNVVLSAVLFICGGAMSASFFETYFVKFTFACDVAFFIIVCAAVSIRKGALAADAQVIAECLLCMVAIGVFINISIKSGTSFLKESIEKEMQTKALLEDLDKKNLETEQLFEKQSSLLGDIRSVVRRLSSATESLSIQADQLADGSSSQASSMENLLGTMSGITDEIRKTEEQAELVRNASETMKHQVEIGSEAMEKMINAVSDIQQSIVQVENITKSIDDIAFQTNILALNASVEAARAGNAGKGFAVVAEEVRNLALRSAEAVASTVQVLENCQNSAAAGCKIAAETSAALDNIKNSTEQVTQMSYKIFDMTSEQMNMINGVNEEISNVSNVVQANAASAGESTTAIKAIYKQTKRLDTLSTAN